jgi:hypothetical protein
VAERLRGGLQIRIAWFNSRRGLQLHLSQRWAHHWADILPSWTDLKKRRSRASSSLAQQMMEAARSFTGQVSNMPTENEIDALLLDYIRDRDRAIGDRATKAGAIAALEDSRVSATEVIAAITRLHAAGTITQLADDELSWRPAE